MCESKHLHTMKPFILIELFYFELDTEQKSAHDDCSISVECRNIVGFSQYAPYRSIITLLVLLREQFRAVYPQTTCLSTDILIKLVLVWSHTWTCAGDALFIDALSLPMICTYITITDNVIILKKKIQNDAHDITKHPIPIAM